MQKMLHLCDVFAADVKFNTAKSVAMRIGPRYDAVCADLILSNSITQYVHCEVFKISWCMYKST